jgi:hypothetical protein
MVLRLRVAVSVSAMRPVVCECAAGGVDADGSDGQTDSGGTGEQLDRPIGRKRWQLRTKGQRSRRDAYGPWLAPRIICARASRCIWSRTRRR